MAIQCCCNGSPSYGPESVYVPWAKLLSSRCLCLFIPIKMSMPLPYVNTRKAKNNNTEQIPSGRRPRRPPGSMSSTLLASGGIRGSSRYIWRSLRVLAWLQLPSPIRQPRRTAQQGQSISVLRVRYTCVAAITSWRRRSIKSLLLKPGWRITHGIANLTRPCPSLIKRKVCSDHGTYWVRLTAGPQQW